MPTQASTEKFFCVQERVWGMTSRCLVKSFPSEQGILAGPGQSTRGAGATAVMKDKEVIGSPEP